MRTAQPNALQPMPSKRYAQQLHISTPARLESIHTGVSMQIMLFPCTHGCCGVPGLVSGTMRACRAQTQHSRALLPTLPWTRRARCCRRRDEGMCSSATVEAVGTRP